MNEGQSQSAWVFARGGSKGLPNKNRSLVGEHTITQLAVLAAKRVPAIEVVYVSTDSEQIAEEAETVGAVVPFLRPDHLAEDDTPEIEAWKHAIVWERTQGVCDSKPFISVPPTSPLRHPKDVTATLSSFFSSRVDLAVTVKRTAVKPGFNLVSLGKDNELSRVSDSQVERAGTNPTRRQDAAEYFLLTTVCYVANRAYVLAQTDLFSGSVVGTLVPEVRGIDIDSELDLRIARFLFEGASSFDE